ncbi:MAG: cupredoxin domain-containing protein [Candidatus Staskawiczbacteria bacterium]|nr:cupredoxin domain-containing protein [Candidatus Staskawiczbacteria bacterium]
MTNKTIIMIIAVVVGLIAIGALAYYMMGNQYQYQPISENENKITENIPEENENAPVPVRREFTVTGRNFSFMPSEIRVKQGDIVKITFDNAQGFHDWVVDEFNARTSQMQAPAKAEAQFTADKTGVFEFYCSVGEHRKLGMKGSLIVE